MYICMHICVCIYVCVYVLCTCVCTYVCVCVCVCVCMYTYVCMYVYIHAFVCVFLEIQKSASLFKNRNGELRANTHAQHCDHVNLLLKCVIIYLLISEFHPGSFWRTNWHRDRFLLKYFCFTLSISFHQCSILIFISIASFSEGQTDEAWDPANRATYFFFPDIGQHWAEKTLSVFSPLCHMLYVVPSVFFKPSLRTYPFCPNCHSDQLSVSFLNFAAATPWVSPPILCHLFLLPFPSALTDNFSTVSAPKRQLLYRRFNCLTIIEHCWDAAGTV